MAKNSYFIYEGKNMLIEEFGRDYGLIAKSKPMFQKSANKNIVYAVNDLFLQFWFRFIYKYNYFIEANAYKKLAEIVERDYETYSGKVLERYFKEVMKESERYTHIDSWWDRKGENEIDIIAADDLAKKVTFYEVKRQRDELDMKVLKDKVQRFMESTGMYGKYEVDVEGLCMEDM